MLGQSHRVVKYIFVRRQVAGDVNVLRVDIPEKQQSMALQGSRSVVAGEKGSA
jgi:hypothetical protein